MAAVDDNILEDLRLRDPTVAIQKVESVIDAGATLTDDTARFLYDATQQLLIRADLHAYVKPRIHMYLEKLLSFAVQQAEHDNLELLATVALIFSASISQRAGFYGRTGRTDEATRALATFLTKDVSAGAPLFAMLPRDGHSSVYLILVVNHFAHKGGVVAIRERLAAANATLESVCALLLIIFQVRSFVTSHFWEQFGSVIEESVVPFLEQYIKEHPGCDTDTTTEEGRLVTDIGTYCRRILRTKDGDGKVVEVWTRHQLTIHLWALSSSAFYSRLTGVQELVQAIDNCRLNMERPGQATPWPDALQLSEWLIDNNVPALILDPEMFNPELLKLASPVFVFLTENGRMEDDVLGRLWRCVGGSHESTKAIIFDVLVAMAPFFSARECTLFDRMIDTTSATDFDSVTIDFVSTFSSNITQQDAQAEGTERQLVVGARFLWTAMDDASALSEQLVVEARNALVTLLRLPHNQGNTTVWMQRCLTNLRSGDSVAPSLSLLTGLLDSLPVRSRWKQRTSVTEQLEKDHGMIALLIADCRRYKRDVTDIFRSGNLDAAGPGPRSAKIGALRGRLPHVKEVDARLNFLLYILSNCPLTLDLEQVDELWQLFVIDALDNAERAAMFNWLKSTRVGTGNGFSAFSDKTAKYLFETRMTTMRSTWMSPEAFSVFERFFCYVNELSGAISTVGKKEDGLFRLSKESALGLGSLWAMAAESDSEEVRQGATKCLRQLHANTPSKKKRLRASFFHTGMDLLGDTDRTQGRVRVLYILRDLLRVMEDDNDSKSQRQAVLLTVYTPPLATPFKLRVRASDTFLALRRVLARHAHVAVDYLRVIVRGEERATESDALPLENLSLVNGTNVYVYIREEAAAFARPVAATPQRRPAIPEQRSRSKLMLSGLSTSKLKWPRRGKGEITPENSLGDFSEAAPVGDSSSDDDDEHVERKEEDHVLASDEYFKQLFVLIDDDEEEVSALAWSLLDGVSPNSGITAGIRNVLLSSQTPSWKKIFPSSKPWRLAYHLASVGQIIGDDGSATWTEQFVRKGGIDFLISLVVDADIGSIVGQTAAWEHALAALLRVVSTVAVVSHDAGALFGVGLAAATRILSVSAPGSVAEVVSRYCATASRSGGLPAIRPGVFGNLRSSPPVREMIHVLLDLSERLAQSTSAAAEEAVEHVLTIIVAACLSARTEGLDGNDARSALMSYALEPWVHHVLLTAPSTEVRKFAATAIRKMCLWQPSGEDEARTADGEIVPAPRAYFLGILIGCLSAVETGPQTSTEYFDLVISLVGDPIGGIVSGEGIDAHALGMQLAKQIEVHGVVEMWTHQASSPTVDLVLVGLFDLMAALCRALPSMADVLGEDSSVLRHVAVDCLLATPEERHYNKRSLPKCKTVEARAAAFRLLAALVGPSVKNLEALSRTLTIEMDLARRMVGTWNYNAAAEQKSSNQGYVGLLNQGATCYMNSIVQQLFFISPFRTGILKARVGEEDSQKSTLLQLQELLANLQESERKFYDTMPFCDTLTSPEGDPINLREQQDADEFLRRLLDTLERTLKGSAKQTLMADIFEGKISNQILCKEGGHLSERMESFVNITLDVQNQEDITKALELYVAGETLDGENKYNCSSCHRPVAATRRACIGELPPVLIIHLKRFEFDFRTMQRYKINDRIEFPEELDMEPYTREGLAQASTPSRQEAWEHREAEYYQYELVGVLVHQGGASSGHYYSFVKERVPLNNGPSTRWFECNDTNVLPFDPKNIDAECFGGAHGESQRQDINSAYMLFYQRKGYDRGVIASEVRSGTSSDPVSRGLVDEFGFESLDSSATSFSFSDDDTTTTDSARPLTQPKRSNASDSSDLLTPTKASSAFHARLSKAVLTPSGSPGASAFPSLARSNTATLSYFSESVPSNIHEGIWEDNMRTLRIRQMFQRDFFAFMWDLVSLYPVEEGAPAALPQLASTFLCSVLIRDQDKPILDLWQARLEALFLADRSSRAALWFITSLTEDHNETVCILLQCPSAEARKATAGVTIAAIECLQNSEDAEAAPALSSLVATIIRILPLVSSYISTCGAYLQVLETLLRDPRDLQHAINDGLVPALVRLLTTQQASPSRTTARSQVSLSPCETLLQAAIELADTGGDAQINATEALSRSPVPGHAPPILTLDATSKSVLHSSEFVVFVLTSSTTPGLPATLSYIAWEHKKMSRRILSRCRDVMHRSGAAKAILDVVASLVALDDLHRAWRVAYAIQQLLAVIDNDSIPSHKRGPIAQAMVKMGDRDECVQAYLFEEGKQIDRVLRKVGFVLNL